MNNQEQQLVEALQNTIKIQNELITFLKAEVERLKAAQIAPASIVGTLSYPQPIMGPTISVPFTAPSQPGFPYSQPIGVTTITTSNSF